MWVELAIALLLGIITGVFTGLCPGIHINLVSAFVLSFLYLFPKEASLPLVVFIVSLSISHTLIDFIPSIFLGAPDDETFLSVLPGHQLLKEGKGEEAVLLSFLGVIIGTLAIILLAFPFSYLLSSIFPKITFIIPFTLIFISLYFIFRDNNIADAIIIFVFAGALGILTFSLPVKEPLLPLLSGLFGLSSLATSLKTKKVLLNQTKVSPKSFLFPLKQFVKPSLKAIFIAPFFSFLPAIGSGHATSIASDLGESNPRHFILMNGIMNSMVLGLSFVTAYSIEKTRTGSSAAVQEILSNISTFNLSAILVTLFVSTMASFFIGILLIRKISTVFSELNYNYLTIIVIVLILIINILFSNWLGMIVLITGAAIGAFAIISGSRRINLLACLIVPTLSYYLTA